MKVLGRSYLAACNSKEDFEYPTDVSGPPHLLGVGWADRDQAHQWASSVPRLCSIGPPPPPENHKNPLPEGGGFFCLSSKVLRGQAASRLLDLGLP